MEGLQYQGRRRFGLLALPRINLTLWPRSLDHYTVRGQPIEDNLGNEADEAKGVETRKNPLAALKESNASNKISRDASKFQRLEIHELKKISSKD